MESPSAPLTVYLYLSLIPSAAVRDEQFDLRN